MNTTKSVSPFLQALLRPSQTSKPIYICTPCLRQQKRALSKATKQEGVPKPVPFVPDVETFFKLIGRGLSAQAGKIPSWEKLFTLSSEELKEVGIEPARTRRYLLRWRQKYRMGDLGPGGDFQHVKDGTAELRVLEVPTIPSQNDPKDGKRFISATSTPGKTKLVLNVPEGTSKIEQMIRKGQSSKDLQKPKGYKLKGGRTITGPFAVPVAKSHGSIAQVKVQEGMWEERLGQKVFGGERRRAETLHKLGVAEHRKAVGTAR